MWSISRLCLQFCSCLVDLVVCIRHHFGGGHRFTLAGAGFVGLVAEHIAQVGDRGADLGDARSRCRELNGETGDGGSRVRSVRAGRKERRGLTRRLRILAVLPES